jgi:uncharacterized protein (TIGR02453 family)
VVRAHRAQYEDHVRQPFLRLLNDLQPDLAGISPHFRSDPRSVGGSLFRIHRDARFSNDKSPYKSWQGARLYHERRKQVPAPSFYLHLQPGECFVGAGLWHPEPDTQRRVRQFIFDNPGGWRAAAHAPASGAGSSSRRARCWCGRRAGSPRISNSSTTSSTATSCSGARSTTPR